MQTVLNETLNPTSWSNRKLLDICSGDLRYLLCCHGEENWGKSKLSVTETRSHCAFNKTFTHNSHSCTQAEARPLIPSLYWVRCHTSLMKTYISVQKESYIYLHTQSKHPISLQRGLQSVNYSEIFATSAQIHQSWLVWMVITYSNTLKDEVCNVYAISGITQNRENSFVFWRNSECKPRLCYWHNEQTWSELLAFLKSHVFSSTKANEEWV